MRRAIRFGRWRARTHGRREPNFQILTLTTRRRERAPDPGRLRVAQIRSRLRVLRKWQELASEGVVRAAEKVAEEHGLSRATLFRWRAVWKKNGPGGLAPDSRRPKRTPKAPPWWVVQVVLTVRLRTGWGAQRVAKELAARDIVRTSHDAVWRLLKAHALQVGPMHRKRNHRVRYERDRPNSLWHVDAKGPIYLKGEGKVYVVGILDDYSRFCLAARFMRRKDAQASADLVAEAIARCGKPRELMTDNGSEFINRPHEAPSPLQKLCAELGIRLCRTAAATPETNGKIEAFWKTFERELLDRWFFTCLAEAQAALDRMRHEYNYHRLHSGIKWTTPASRYAAQESYDTGFAGNLDLEDLSDWLKQLKASAQARS